MRVAVRAATSGSARNLSAQTGANTAMTALSELVPANFSAVVRLMKPKPYESSIIPTTTPPAPVHREGFTTSQLIVIGLIPPVREKQHCTRLTEGNLSKIAHSTLQTMVDSARIVPPLSTLSCAGLTHTR